MRLLLSQIIAAGLLMSLAIYASKADNTNIQHEFCCLSQTNNFPAPGGGSVPAAGGGSVPAVGGGSVPAAGGGSVPAAGGGSVPAAGGGSVPAVGGGSVPAAGGGSIPGTGASPDTNTGFSCTLDVGGVGGACIPGGTTCNEQQAQSCCSTSCRIGTVKGTIGQRQCKCTKSNKGQRCVKNSDCRKRICPPQKSRKCVTTSASFPSVPTCQCDV